MKNSKEFFEELKLQLSPKELSVVQLSFFEALPKSSEEIGQYFGTSKEEILKILDGIKKKRPELYEKINEYNNFRNKCFRIVNAFTENGKSFSYTESVQIIEEVLVGSTERDKKTICLILSLEDDEGKTLKTVGKEVGLSGERVRQIRESAFLKIRKKIRLRLSERNENVKKITSTISADDILAMLNSYDEKNNK